MKYIKKINLTDVTDNKDLKKTIAKSYHQGTEYYEEVEQKQHKEKED